MGNQRLDHLLSKERAAVRETKDLTWQPGVNSGEYRMWKEAIPSRAVSTIQNFRERMLIEEQMCMEA